MMGGSVGRHIDVNGFPPCYAILTCIDGIIDHHNVAAQLANAGHKGSPHFIRNAGGRISQDSIRSVLVARRVLGIAEVVIVHHTACGMEVFHDDTFFQFLDDDQMYEDCKKQTFVLVEEAARFVQKDLKDFRGHPLVKNIKVSGYLMNSETGQLCEVAPSQSIGKDFDAIHFKPPHRRNPPKREHYPNREDHGVGSDNPGLSGEKTVVHTPTATHH
eukprot:TRINITY_DN892_c0_g1_i2.p1 TRINITY_DN892_c0_g1~~TRINITY_DN892_c0_g1_i2.p1  ORF type:complete len:216 (+),score=47.96 TRINITY_DN892_c0_g1_i2:117-764(+)